MLWHGLYEAGSQLARDKFLLDVEDPRLSAQRPPGRCKWVERKERALACDPRAFLIQIILCSCISHNSTLVVTITAKHCATALPVGKHGFHGPNKSQHSELVAN